MNIKNRIKRNKKGFLITTMTILLCISIYFFAVHYATAVKLTQRDIATLPVGSKIDFAEGNVGKVLFDMFNLNVSIYETQTTTQFFMDTQLRNYTTRINIIRNALSNLSYYQHSNYTLNITPVLRWGDSAYITINETTLQYNLSLGTFEEVTIHLTGDADTLDNTYVPFDDAGNDPRLNVIMFDNNGFVVHNYTRRLDPFEANDPFETRFNMTTFLGNITVNFGVIDGRNNILRIHSENVSISFDNITFMFNQTEHDLSLKTFEPITLRVGEISKNDSIVLWKE